MKSADLGFATLDLDRHRRCGFPEVIFAEGKTAEWRVALVTKWIAAGQDCLVTRLNESQAEALSRQYPEGIHDRLARTFYRRASEPPPKCGLVAVVTAGTSDLPVAQEAVVTASAMGAEVKLIADVG